MSNRRRATEKKVGLFLANPSYVAGGVFPVSMDNARSLPTSPAAQDVGPEDAGPGDEWQVRTEPLETEDEVTLEPVHSDGIAVLPRQPTHKR